MYDDDTFFTFNHPEQSNLALVQSIEQMNDPDGSNMVSELKGQLKTLSDSEKAGMSPDEVEEHENNQMMIQNMMEQIAL